MSPGCFPTSYPTQSVHAEKPTQKRDENTRGYGWDLKSLRAQLMAVSGLTSFYMNLCNLLVI